MPAVLVHGVPDTNVIWDEVCAALGRTDVVRPDLPGFAAPLPAGFEPTKEAYAAWLAAELEAIGEPVDLVGHDWGSLLAVRVATTRPDLVRTLACGGGPVDETYVWHDTAQLWQTPGVGEQVMEALTPETLGPALPAMGLTPAQAERTAAGITEEMKAAILGLYRSAVTVGAEWSPAMDGFDRPALVLWGADDPYAPAHPFAERMAGRLGGRAVVFAGCRHWWPSERPAEVAAELDQLWAQASR
jgi:pimeloyl-ACP methyl ester carboxylesterase